MSCFGLVIINLKDKSFKVFKAVELSEPKIFAIFEVNTAIN